MSQPGTAEDKPCDESKQAEPEAVPAAVKALCVPAVYEDELTVIFKKYWGMFQSCKSSECTAIPHDEYAVLMRGVLKLSGVGDTHSNILSLRLCQHDSVGRDAVKLDAMVRRLKTFATRLWSAGTLEEKLERMLATVSEGRKYKSFSDIDHDPTCASLEASCPVVYRPDSCSQNCFVILGDPCVGKSALGRELCDRLGTVHLDVVNLALAEVRRGTELGRQLSELVGLNNAIPIEVQGGLIGAEMKRPAVTHRGYVFDEFPVMPSTAKGDDRMAKWVAWCGFGSSATHVVSIACRQSLSAADEWTKCYEATQKRWARKDEEEARLVRLEEIQDKAAEEAKLQATENEGEGGEEGGGDAEGSEQEQAEDQGELAKRAERRLLHAINKSVHLGQLEWYKESESQQLWEGDTPFLSPAVHFELAKVVSNATARGCCYEVQHIEDAKRQADQVLGYCPWLYHVDIPTAPQVPVPEQGADTDALEQEMLASILKPFSVWGKTCPVTYKVLGITTLGLYTYPSVYHGKLYYFTTPERREQFVAGPGQFLEAPPRLVNKPILLLSKQRAVLDVATRRDVDHELVKQMGYTPIPLESFAGEWKEHNDELARIEEERLQRELAEKQREAEEKSKEKKGKKKKGEDKKKEKKKKEEEVEQPPEPEETKAEEVEAPPLSFTEQKLADIEVELCRAVLEPSIILNGVNADTPQWLEYLQKHKLLPSTVIVLDIPKEEVEDPEEEVEEKEEEEPKGDDEAPKDVPPPCTDMTDAAYYEKYIGEYMASLAPGEEEESKPKIDVRVVSVKGTDSAVQMVAALAQDMNPFKPPVDEEGEGEGEGDAEEAEKDDDEEGPAEEPRLTPGRTALSRYGATGKYCPVSAASGLLVVGDPEHRVKYSSKKWLFRSEKEKALFEAHPAQYSAGAGIPPPAFWLLGTGYSYQPEVREALEQIYEIPEIDFTKLRETVAQCVAQGVGCEHILSAQRALKEMSDFDALQTKRKKEKEVYEQTEHEADDNDPELEEWEPEEEEARAERIMSSNIKVLHHLVRAEPFRSHGHVLFNISEKEEHLDLLAASDVVPEVVVTASLSRETYLRRCLPLEVERRMKQVEEKKSTKKQRTQEKEAARKQRALERWRRRNLDGDDEDDDEDEEEEDVQDVNTEDVSEELGAAFDESIAAIEGIVSKQRDGRVPILSVSAEVTSSVFVSVFMLKLRTHLAHRPSMLCAPHLTTDKDVLVMLQHEEAVVSSFGRCDPVEQYELRHGTVAACKFKHAPSLGKVEGLADGSGDEQEEQEASPEPPKEDDAEEPEAEAEEASEQEPELTEEEAAELLKAEEAKREKRAYPKPVFFDGQIYYCSSERTLLKFLDHPLRYSTQEPLLSSYVSVDPCKAFSEGIPVVAYEAPLFVTVIGDNPCRDGRSLAEHLAHNLGAVHISKRKLIKAILSTGTVLADEIMQLVVERKSIGNGTLYAKMLALRLGMSDVCRQGCVVEGLPDTSILAEMLHSEVSAICPAHNVIVQQGENTDLWENIEAFYENTQGNVTSIKDEGREGTLTELIKALKAVRKSRDARSELARRRFAGLPADLAATAQELRSVRDRVSKYRTYCAWEWITNKRLVPWGGVAMGEYSETTYFFSSKDHLADFLAHPAKYEDQTNQFSLPVDLPQPLSEEETERVQHEPTYDPAVQGKTEWEFRGFCPVTLFTTKNNVGLKGAKQPTAVPGLNEQAVKYKDRFYRMSSQATFDKFLMEPWMYIEGAALPGREPVLKEFLNDGKVSMQTYITETLYEAVAKAMVAVGDTRPGFPGCSVKSSALRYIAAHLRANNPKNSALRAQMYRRNLDDYTEACSLADFFLSNEVEAAPEETKNKKKALWDAIQTKEVLPKKYEVLRPDDL